MNWISETFNKTKEKEAVSRLVTMIDGAGREVEVITQPIRDSLLKRYPTISALLVTTGVTATFLGIEQILLRIEVFNNNPWLVLFLGVTLLVFTGRLYKKLG